ncbi:hypothetical protein AAMO2058_001204800 [Amorphochlora amoebiformis]
MAGPLAGRFFLLKPSKPKDSETEDTIERRQHKTGRQKRAKSTEKANMASSTKAADIQSRESLLSENRRLQTERKVFLQTIESQQRTIAVLTAKLEAKFPGSGTPKSSSSPPAETAAKATDPQDGNGKPPAVVVTVSDVGAGESKVPEENSGNAVEKKEKEEESLEDFTSKLDEEIALQYLKQGAFFIKFNQGNDKSSRKFVWLSKSILRTELFWKSQGKQRKSAILSQITAVLKGKETKPFNRPSAAEVSKDRCFSLLIGGGNSLDLVAESPRIRDEWVACMQFLIKPSSP